MGYSIYGAGPGGGARGCVRGASPEGPSTQALRFGGDVARGVRDMAPIRTPFGVLTLTAEFRRDCSFGVSGAGLRQLRTTAWHWLARSARLASSCLIP